jgi:hypothetical protein
MENKHPFQPYDKGDLDEVPDSNFVEQFFNGDETK